MAALGKYKKSKPKKAARGGPRRVSPLKPGLTGARNWAASQMRAARYSKQKMTRMIVSGVVLSVAVLWSALWLGGFIPDIQSASARFTKTRLMNMGFVVKHVDIVGDGRVSELEVKAMLGVQPGDYLFDMDIKNAQKRIESISWVETAVVRRLWPNRIDVHIVERRPYALWQKDNVLKVADKSGIIVTGANLEDFGYLPLIVGAGGAENAQEFLEMMAGHEAISINVKAAVYVSERRWDIILKDGGPRIMLPAANPEEALTRLDGYIKTHGLLGLDLERIDMRVEGRLTLRPRAKDTDRRA